jgi:hypothetical protein
MLSNSVINGPVSTVFPELSTKLNSHIKLNYINLELLIHNGGQHFQFIYYKLVDNTEYKLSDALAKISTGKPQRKRVKIIDWWPSTGTLVINQNFKKKVKIGQNDIKGITAILKRENNNEAS